MNDIRSNSQHARGITYVANAGVVNNGTLNIGTLNVLTQEPQPTHTPSPPSPDPAFDRAHAAIPTGGGSCFDSGIWLGGVIAFSVMTICSLALLEWKPGLEYYNPLATAFLSPEGILIAAIVIVSIFLLSDGEVGPFPALCAVGYWTGTAAAFIVVPAIVWTCKFLGSWPLGVWIALALVAGAIVSCLILRSWAKTRKPAFAPDPLAEPGY